MKKIYQSEKYKCYSARKSIRFRKRASRKGSRHRSQNFAQRKPHFHEKPKELVAPEHFSLTENIEETITFFAILYEELKGKYRIEIDLRGVRKLTPDAILYLLSLLDMFMARGINVKGNAPLDRVSRQVFTESGFYKYVKSDRRQLSQNENILAVESGSQVFGAIASKVIEFAKEKLQVPIIQSRKIYTAILECMGNTHQHAYGENYGYQKKWWLMALFNSIDNEVTFTLLDNGQGIPATVKRKLGDWFFMTDSKLIQSALRGELRTRTGLNYRGKGLPRIHQTMREKYINNLIVISRHGYVNYLHDEGRDIHGVFHGTMVSWTLRGERESDDDD